MFQSQAWTGTKEKVDKLDIVKIKSVLQRNHQESEKIAHRTGKIFAKNVLD